MKNLKRILCFLLMFVTIGFFTACSKGKSSTNSGGKTDLSQGGGQSGGGDSGDSSSGESGGGEDEPQEVYVPYTSKEIMNVGSDFIESFFEDFEVDLDEAKLFDKNVNDTKFLFLNASKMIKYVAQMEDLTFGACVKGNELDLVDYQGKPNSVAKFYVTHAKEDVNGNSNVRIKILFSYNALDIDFNFDYYDILIETNKAQKLVSCDLAIERSSQKNGLEDSSAKYYVFDLDGNIDCENSYSLYNVYQFERTEHIETQTVIDYNVIDEFKQSSFNGKTASYIGGEDAKLLLRNSTSSQSIYVAQKVGNMSQGRKKLFGGIFGIISGLSEALVVYVDAETEIV